MCNEVGCKTLRGKAMTNREGSVQVVVGCFDQVPCNLDFGGNLSPIFFQVLLSMLYVTTLIRHITTYKTPLQSAHQKFPKMQERCEAPIHLSQNQSRDHNHGDLE